MKYCKLFVEAIDRKVVFERDKGICHICNESVNPESWHIDHIVPLKLGGKHEYANVAVAHPSCNSRKGAKLMAIQGGDFRRGLHRGL